MEGVVQDLLEVLVDRSVYLTSAPGVGLNARQLAAGGLMRCRDLLSSLLLLHANGQCSGFGILVRAHWETWLVSLWTLLKGNAAVHRLSEDKGYWEKKRGAALDLGAQYLDQIQQVLESHGGEAKRLNYRELAKDLEDILAARQEATPVTQHYDLLYRGESIQNAHAALTSLAQYVDIAGDPWAVRTHPEGAPTRRRLGTATLLTCQLGRHVFTEFGLETTPLEALAVELIAVDSAARDPLREPPEPGSENTR